MNGPDAPGGSTSGIPEIVTVADAGAPITSVLFPVTGTAAEAPGAKVCASTVAPFDVMLIQQALVVAPIRSE